VPEKQKQRFMNPKGDRESPKVDERFESAQEGHIGIGF